MWPKGCDWLACSALSTAAPVRGVRQNQIRWWQFVAVETVVAILRAEAERSNLHVEPFGVGNGTLAIL